MLTINEVHHGDCLELMKDIDDGCIDMVLCDLPYGTTACEWDILIPFEALWRQYKRILSPVGSIVLFSSGMFTTQLLCSNPEMYKYKYVWVKNNTTNFVHAKNRPMTSHEDILVFSNAPMGHTSLLGEKRMVYNPQGLKKKRKTTNGKKEKKMNIVGLRPSHVDRVSSTHTNYPTDVLWGFPEPTPHEKVHTSQKSLELCEYLVKTYTNEGDLVLDNCAGSGTTGLACIKAKRKFILMELEKKYVDIARERIEKYQKQENLAKWDVLI